MIHHALFDELSESDWNGFVFPRYGEQSLAEIVPSVEHFFGLDVFRPRLFYPELVNPAGMDKIVFFFVDGFGWDHFMRHKSQLQFLKQLSDIGNIYPITSVFPSTTPAALTTIHTGLTPQEHGLPEWLVYFEEVGEVLETLPFRVRRTRETDGAMQIGGRPEMLYDGRTIYEVLRRAGIPSQVFIDHHYAQGAYSRMTHRGAEVVSFTYGTDLMEKLLVKLATHHGPGYFFVYWSSIDAAAHSFGPGSAEHVQEISSFFSMLQQKFINQFPRRVAEKILLMLSADHGHTNIVGDDIIFLNRYLELKESLVWGLNNQVIAPTGAPHDVFLFIYPPKLDQTIRFLKAELKGRAEVWHIVDALNHGLFGFGVPSAKFLRRIGNVLILPYKNHHVWYAHEQDEPYRVRGMHGGLTSEEMIVPLAMAPLSALLAK